MKTFLSTIFCFVFFVQFAQNGELGNFDCTFSKEITYPFNYSASQTIVKPQLNQVVFYANRDQFTYWYKISVKQNDTLYYNIKAINDSDAYAVYIYQYNESDFCNKLYSKKIKYLGSPLYIDHASAEKEITKPLSVKNDNVYYISVVNISLNNCGHYFMLSSKKDTLKVKAFHLPCKKDVSVIAINQKKDAQPIKVAEPIESKKETIKPLVTQTLQPIHSNIETIPSAINFECFVKDKKTLKFIKASVTVIDTDIKELIVTNNISLGVWQMILENTKSYSVKCTAFGYKDLITNIDLKNKESIELFLEPLNVGDNFIMKSIYFHPNTYALRKESSNDLQSLLNFMTENPSVAIEVQGHTNGDHKIFKSKANSSLGEEWNFQGSSKNLSLLRSQTIKTFLVNNGINAERLIAVGIGGKKPIIENPETMEDGQKNIRVEIVILKN